LPSAAETVPGWTSFLQTLMQSHPGLASCLMEGLPSLEDQNNRLVVAFAADKVFQMERLAQDRGTLERHMATCWGRPLQLRLITAGTAQRSGEQEAIRRAVAPTEQEVLEEVCREDRSLSRLVELLQGEAVAEPEGAGWQPEAGGPQDRDV